MHTYLIIAYSASIIIFVHKCEENAHKIKVMFNCGVNSELIKLPSTPSSRNQTRSKFEEYRVIFELIHNKLLHLE